MSSDSTTATASDTSLFASEQALQALGFLKTIGKTSGQTIQYDTLPDGTALTGGTRGAAPSFCATAAGNPAENWELYLSQDKQVITEAITRSRGEQHAQLSCASSCVRINPVMDRVAQVDDIRCRQAAFRSPIRHR